MQTKLQEIRDRADKAIEGPWVPKKFGCSEVSIYKGPVKVKGCGMTHGGEICQMDDPDCSDFKSSQLKDTAEFIAHARQDIPYLLDALEQAQEENKQLKQPDEQIERLITIDDLACRCGYYRQIEEGDGYGCFHPLGDDHDNEGHCRTYGCPVAIEADIEDLKRLDNYLYEEYKGDARDDGGIESDWMKWRGETAQTYKDMLIQLKHAQARERGLREALESLSCEAQRCYYEEYGKGNLLVDLVIEIEQAEKALKQEVTNG